jgi:hypothetical protein
MRSPTQTCVALGDLTRDRLFSLPQFSLLALPVALPEVGNGALVLLALRSVARRYLGLPIRRLPWLMPKRLLGNDLTRDEARRLALTLRGCLSSSGWLSEIDRQARIAGV